jgi:hypothetical protein
MVIENVRKYNKWWGKIKRKRRKNKGERERIKKRGLKRGGD